MRPRGVSGVSGAIGAIGCGAWKIHRLRFCLNATTTLITDMRCLRERFCAVASDCAKGTLDDDATWAALAEAHSKLLLYGLPHAVPGVVELEQRFAFWENRDFEGLLLRVQPVMECCSGQRRSLVVRRPLNAQGGWRKKMLAPRRSLDCKEESISLNQTSNVRGVRSCYFEPNTQLQQ